MKKTRLLNHLVSDAIARIGHTQCIVISDAGFPVPFGVQRIDLAIVPGLPTAAQVAEAVAAEMEVEAIIVADELVAREQAWAEEMALLFGAPWSQMPHSDFKKVSEGAIAVIRTADVVPYHNVILISGVNY